MSNVLKRFPEIPQEEFAKYSESLKYFQDVSNAIADDLLKLYKAQATKQGGVLRTGEPMVYSLQAVIMKDGLAFVYGLDEQRVRSKDPYRWFPARKTKKGVYKRLSKNKDFIGLDDIDFTDLVWENVAKVVVGKEEIAFEYVPGLEYLEKDFSEEEQTLSSRIQRHEHEAESAWEDAWYGRRGLSQIVNAPYLQHGIQPERPTPTPFENDDPNDLPF